MLLKHVWSNTWHSKRLKNKVEREKWRLGLSLETLSLRWKDETFGQLATVLKIGYAWRVFLQVWLREVGEVRQRGEEGTHKS